MKSHIERVVAVPYTGADTWHQNKDYYTVHAIWTGVDRPRSTGWICKQKYVARLTKALLAGVVFTNAEVNRDINGRTYVSARSLVQARTINADLAKLGF